MPSRNGKKPESGLGLVAAEPPALLHTEVIPSLQDRALTREEKRITEEFDKRVLIVEAECEIAKFGNSAIGDIRNHASFVFHDTARSILDRQKEVVDEELLAYTREFDRHNIQGCARDLLAVSTGATLNIGSTVTKSFELPPESFWKRHFG